MQYDKHGRPIGKRAKRIWSPEALERAQEQMKDIRPIMARMPLTDAAKHIGEPLTMEHIKKMVESLPKPEPVFFDYLPPMKPVTEEERHSLMFQAHAMKSILQKGESTIMSSLTIKAELPKEEVSREITSPTLEKLRAMYGMGTIVKEIESIIAQAQIAQARKRHGLPFEKQSLHMVFKGAPGTGKTTIARMVGEIFKEVGLLPKPPRKRVRKVDEDGDEYTEMETPPMPFIEVDVSSIYDKYNGGSEQNMKELIKQAHGGVMFIDEAYALMGRSDHGIDQKVMSILVKGMEDNAGKFITILAGYEDDMQKLLDFNEGLRSRVQVHLNFPDYDTEELVKIASNMAEERGYTISPFGNKVIVDIIELEKKSGAFGNARSVRNIVETCIRKQSLRLIESDLPLTKEVLQELQTADFVAVMGDTLAKVELEQSAAHNKHPLKRMFKHLFLNKKK